MILKEVTLNGFKSFVNKTEIEFSSQINGIVGPNGCGKSNISDAIKWVLGEQSAKTLRAGEMSDVIFAGSKDHKKRNFAEVSLLFDNSDYALKIDFNEVLITRRVYRSGESEYYLNKNKTRLKDIRDLMLDVRLGKDNLSIISQGQVSEFINAKTEEKRVIFEQAAGIYKYKKRKDEALRKLKNTDENLLRISDLLSELELQIEPLQKQCEQTKKYLELKEQLEASEVHYIIQEVSVNTDKLSDLTNQLTQRKDELVKAQAQVEELEAQQLNLKNEKRTIEAQLDNYQNRLMQVNESLMNYEREENKADYYGSEQLSLFQDTKINLKAKKNKLVNETVKLKEAVGNKYQQLSKVENQKSMLEHDLAKYQQEYFLYKSKKEVYQESQNNLFQGVKNVLKAQDKLAGIVGLVQDLYQVEPKLQLALETSLESSLQNIVVDRADDAQAAINYLKSINGGRANFMPLDTIKPSKTSNLNEGLGFAYDLINYDSKYHDIFTFLLNKTIICDDLTQARGIAKKTNNQYKLVTLDGDLIRPGGVFTGGSKRKQKQHTNELMLDKQINDYQVKINTSKEALEKLNVTYAKLNNQLMEDNTELTKINENINHLQMQIEDLDYKITNITSHDVVKLSEKINLLKEEKETLMSNITTHQQAKKELDYIVEDLENELRKVRTFILEQQPIINKLEINKTKIEVNNKSFLDLLATEYHHTYETALKILKEPKAVNRKEIESIKRQIKELGNVNLLAIEEYEKVSERYTFIKDEKEDLLTAREDIKSLVKDYDTIMIEKFKKTIEDVNQEFNIIFNKLFNGGQARLEYTQPDNLLETGIEIIAQPPGKAIQNLNLFSGGEKALIALAVLFAIIKTRPIPLCILDEVEAALDQANVDRFASLLKEFNFQTQFIVITHRQGTMECCDKLYGVTMQEKGVSKIIGVELTDKTERVSA